jgi:hypothetical protein
MRKLYLLLALLFLLASPSHGATEEFVELPPLPMSPFFPLIITQTQVIDFTLGSAPALPQSGHVRLYANSGTGKLACIDASGAACLPSGGGGSSLTLQTNGVANGSQALLNLIGGAGTTVTDNGSGGITIATTGVVTSVFGRTGAVVAAANDYSFSQISGTATAAQLPASVVFNNQSNTYTPGGALQDFSSATMKIPQIAAYAPTTAGLWGYDTTNNRPVLGNGTNTSFLPWFTGTPVNGQYLKFSGTLGLVVSAPATSPTLQVNGTPNGNQGLLNMASGSNITLTDNGTGTVTIAGSGGTATTSRLACEIIIGADNGSALGNADIAPQGRQCYMPTAGTVLEVDVTADAGTPNVTVANNHAGVLSDLTSAPLATAGSGGLACSNTGGTLGLDGATTCSATLQNTSFVTGDYIQTHAGTAGGTAKRLSISVILSVNATAGTVNSVALTVPSWLSVAGSPITTSGTLAVSPASAQTSHQVIGTCGSATTFAPCALVAGDLPAGTGTVTSIGITQTGALFTITGSPVTTSGNINLSFTGTLPVANGGTGATVKQTAFNNLAPTPTRAGDVTYYNGSNYVNLAGNNSGTNCFQENSSGVPSWAACGGGGGTPAGSNTQFQYNNAGAFGGTNGFTWNNTNGTPGLALGAITTDIQPFPISWTTNNGAQVFTGFKIVVTNTAQAAGSLNFQVCGGTTGSLCFTIDPSGNGVLPGTLTVGNGSVAGNWNFPQGPLPGTPIANAWQIAAGTTVAVGDVQWIGPNASGTAASGIVMGAASAPVVTLAQSGDAKHSARQTAQVATITNKSICLAADCPAGEYELKLHLNSTVTCATPGPGTLSPTATFTDDAGTKTAQTIPLVVNGGATLATTMALGNTTNQAYGSVLLWSTGVNPIQLSLNYTACTTGTGTFSYSAEVVQLQ